MPPAPPSPPPVRHAAHRHWPANTDFSLGSGCASTWLPKLLGLECDAARAAAAAADEAADVATLQKALHALQHPADCAGKRIFTFRDWRNGLGAQLSTLVGVWSGLLNREALSGSPIIGPHAPLLAPGGGLRYANKAQCPARDLSCYFEPFATCAAPSAARKAKPAKTPPELASRLSEELRLRLPRDKQWLRRELTRYVFRINGVTRAMLDAVREEMGLRPAAEASEARERARDGGASSMTTAVDGRLHVDALVGLHVRRGDKRDLGAKERGEPFSDAMYVQAAKALAAEVGASGFLLASSEPDTLRRLPALLQPLPTYTMPAKYFVQVPEGLTPHQVIERTKQETGANDEGRSQIVQLLLLAECRAFLGTVTSNFGLLVTKLMAFRVPTPLSLDLSCAGLSAMQSATHDGDVPVWRLKWTPKDATRCRRYGRHEDVPKRGKKSKS